ncbi:fimbrial biogenesis chaperone [Piscirickettsia litoralis]|uniref:Pilus assembly protein n=1 Tax=Piscirickettsia litoralis TaxID=1891921 RepID=A0ABX3A136_9GAMM|nr:pilus assembly protein [Piscirickettsia litoralis]ODN42168.1 pilus assembly protein [Piscirickettsia litoralis]
MKRLLSNTIAGVLALGASVASFGASSYLVAPGKVMLSLQRPSTSSFIVRNTGDTTLHLRAKLEYYPTNSEVLGLGSQQKGFDDDLLKHARVLISPPLLVMPAGQQRTLRVSVRPKAGLKEGTYRAYLRFSPSELIKQPIKVEGNVEGNQVGAQINIRLDTVTSIYADKGEGAAKVSVKCVKGKKNTEVIVDNNSPWMYRGSIANGKSSVPVILMGYNTQKFELKKVRSTIQFAKENSDKGQEIRCS